MLEYQWVLGQQHEEFQVINTGDGLGLKRRMHFLTHDHVIQCVSLLARKNFPLFEDIKLFVTEVLAIYVGFDVEH